VATIAYSRRTSFPQVIAIHGPAGGVGKTTVALHLAYMYALKGCATVLVDLSQYGAVAPWLRIPRGTSSGLSGFIALQTQGGARSHAALVPAPGAGEKLNLLLSSGPAKMDQVHANDVESVLKYLSSFAQVVIVDTGSELTDRALGALMAATQVAVTVSPHVLAGWHALELLDVVRSAYLPRDKFGLLLNRVQPGGPFSVDEYAKTIGLPVVGCVPESADLRRAAEVGGAPAVTGSGAGVRALRTVAHHLIPIFAAKELRRSWLWSR
jgi:Flp pilus assembly CpaE family ATPase